MDFIENQIYHIYNQGNDKNPIFFQERNYNYFLGKMEKYITPYADLLCYCLMPNHFHILAAVNNINVTLKNGKTRTFNFSIGLMLRSYTDAINKQENRSGSLFRAHTKAKDGSIDKVITVGSKNEGIFFKYGNNYARTCFGYIHDNPVKALLVKNAQEWEFSSARDYAGLRSDSICNIERAKELLSL